MQIGNRPKTKQVAWREKSCSEMATSETVGSNLVDEVLNRCSPKLIFPCSACDAVLGTKTALRNHMKRHLGQLGYACKLCEKKFWNVNDLQGHMSARHTNIKVHVCQRCGRSFSYKKTLVRHQRNDHNTMQQ